MPTVVLIGYSTAGKSTVLKTAKERWPTISTMESDQAVAGGRHDHVFDLFIQMGRKDALPLIEPREREFLHSLMPIESPRLIAAGPAVPRHDADWAAFVARVQPEVVYIQLSALEALEGLRRRAEEHAENSAMQGHANLGSWDEGITTERTADGWRPVSDEQALRLIEEDMGRLMPRYESATRPELRFARDQVRHDETFMRTLGRLLRIEQG